MNSVELMRKVMRTYDLKQIEVAEILKCSDSYINQILKGKCNLSKPKRELLLTKYPIEIDETNTLIDVYYFKDLGGSCGQGSLIDYVSPETETLQLSSKYGLSQHSKYFCINAFGDSMIETIHDKEVVIFEDWHDKQIIDNKIYLFSLDNKYYIKRLAYNIDEVTITSDNKTKDENGNYIYSTKKIKGDDINRLYIYGRFRGKIEKD